MLTTGQALAITLYLLPGLLGLFILETLAERVSSDNLRRLTLVVTIALFAAAIVIKIGDYDALPAVNGGAVDFNTFLETSFIWSCATGLFLGVLGAWLSNVSIVNRLLSKIVSTTKAGKTDPWHDAFTENKKVWCKLHFKSGDRLVGYPKSYSMDGERMGLFVGDATWKRKKPDGFVSEDVDGPGVLITKFDEVESIEFIN